MQSESVKKISTLLKDRQNIMRAIILFEVFYASILDGWFSSFIDLSFLSYGLDVLNVVLLCGLFIDYKKLKNIKEPWIFLSWALYAAVCLISDIANSVDLLLIVWACRNTFRFLVFFTACTVYIQKRDIKNVIKFMLKLQYINLPLTVIEYFLLRANRFEMESLWLDRIGGIFGVPAGITGRLNIYLCVIFTAALAEAYERNKLTWRYAFIAVSTLVCATVAEIKFFYIESILLFLVVTFVYIRKVKFTLILECAGILALSYALTFLMQPVYWEIVFKKYDKYEQGNAATNVYTITRSKAFSDINKIFFGDSMLYRTIGMGFGNCEESSISLFNSAFAAENAHYHYRWFSHQMLYIETGILGFITFASIPFVQALNAYVSFNAKNTNTFIKAFTIGVAAILFINLWYNNSSRDNIAYLSMLCLAALQIFERDAEGKSIQQSK